MDKELSCLRGIRLVKGDWIVMDYILSMLKQLGAFGGKYLLFFIVYITPIHNFLITILILLFFDLVTGITKSVIKKEVITSKRMRDSIIKLIYYTIAVFIAYQIDVTHISKDALFLSRLVSGYITLIEFTSNLENISAITGVNIWVAIKKKVLAIFENKILDSKDDKAN